MSTILSLGMGYLIGCISPAAWISKRKDVDLTKEGTKNLGATNTGLVLGKKAGIFVMIFDILKSFFSYRLARFLFPQAAAAKVIASIGTILGHCFPVHRKFRGGKGLAAFGGLILAYSPIFFLLIVIPGILLMLLFNVGVAAPIYGTILFPILVWLDRGIDSVFYACTAASAIIFLTHWNNLQLARQKKDVINTKDYVNKVFGKKK